MKNYTYKALIFMALFSIWSCANEDYDLSKVNETTNVRESETNFLPELSASEYYEMLESTESEEMFDLKLALLSYGLYNIYNTNDDLGGTLTNTLFLNFPCDGYYNFDDLFNNFKIANPGGFNDDDVKDAMNDGIAQKISIDDSEAESINFVEQIMESLTYKDIHYPTTLFIENYQFHSKQYFAGEGQNPEIGPGVAQYDIEEPIVFVFAPPSESDLGYIEINQAFTNKNFTIMVLNGDPSPSTNQVNDPCGPNGNGYGGNSGNGGNNGSGSSGDSYKTGVGFPNQSGSSSLEVRITDMTINDDFEGGFLSGKHDVYYQARLYQTGSTTNPVDCTDDCGDKYKLGKLSNSDLGNNFSPTTGHHISLIQDWDNNTNNRMWLVIYEHDWPAGKRTRTNSNLDNYSGTTDIVLRAKFDNEVYFDNAGTLETGVYGLSRVYDFLNNGATKTVTQNSNSFRLERIN